MRQFSKLNYLLSSNWSVHLNHNLGCHLKYSCKIITSYIVQINVHILSSITALCFLFIYMLARNISNQSMSQMVILIPLLSIDISQCPSELKEREVNKVLLMIYRVEKRCVTGRQGWALTGQWTFELDHCCGKSHIMNWSLRSSRAHALWPSLIHEPKSTSSLM